MIYPDDVWTFIEENQGQDSNNLALKLAKQNNDQKNFIIQQIIGKQKAKQKFPFLLKQAKFLYPSKRAIEQASSAITAEYKSKQLKGKRIADLSGGMGIDSYFFAQEFETVHYVEQNRELFETTKHNFQLQGVQNVSCYHSKAENFLQAQDATYDWLYIDPDRRKHDQRLHNLEDCEPQVLNLLPHLFKKSDSLVLKLSPLVDLKQLLLQLPQCYELQIIAVKNECKEVLALINKAHQGEAKIKAIDLAEPDRINYSFSFLEEEIALIDYHQPLNYLYEPNAAVLKAGAFKKIAKDYELFKLAQHTHLYTAEKLVNDFPGRVIKIDWWGKPQKGKCTSANVVKRNFPLSTAQIRKKYKIKESLNTFCYACSLNDDRHIFVKGELVR